MTAGSNRDMAIAYVFRVFTVIIQSAGALMLWAVIQLGITIRDDTRDIKKEWPEMKESVKKIQATQDEMKRESANYATTAQLKGAKEEVMRIIDEQIKKKRTLTTPGNHHDD